MSDQDFLDAVASEGVAYAVLNYSSGIEDKRIREHVKKAATLLRKIETWAENHPNFEEM